MIRKAIIQKIKIKAKRDRKNRLDPRFLDTMGFLVAKGFLRTNFNVQHMPNKRINIKDAIWAGQNVEPRILEVLPAAILRLEKHFDLKKDQYPMLEKILNMLQRNEEYGEAFFDIPYQKLKMWLNFPLRDKRTKAHEKKKLMRTFRLTPLAILKLKELANQKNCSEAAVLEEVLFKHVEHI